MTNNDTQAAFGAYVLPPYQAWLLRKAQSTSTGWWGRRVALTLRRSVLSRDIPVIDAVVDGLRFRLHMRDNVSERKFLFMPQFFDRYERDLLKKTLKPGHTFVDIGANAGIYTLSAAALVGEGGRVIAIEPNPAVLDRLKFNVALNDFEKRVVCEQSAVSDSSGTFDLALDESNLGGSSLVMARSARKISVHCDRLLPILRKHDVQKISALKIDIEGAEDRALAPFFQDAPKSLYPGLLIVENAPQGWPQDLRAILQKAGYQLLRVTRMNQIWALPA